MIDYFDRVFRSMKADQVYTADDIAVATGLKISQVTYVLGGLQRGGVVVGTPNKQLGCKQYQVKQKTLL